MDCTVIRPLSKDKVEQVVQGILKTQIYMIYLVFTKSSECTQIPKCLMDCNKLVCETLEQAAFAKVSWSLPPKTSIYASIYEQTYKKHTGSD